jgi:hypothetical protein
LHQFRFGGIGGLSLEGLGQLNFSLDLSAIATNTGQTRMDQEGLRVNRFRPDVQQSLRESLSVIDMCYQLSRASLQKYLGEFFKPSVIGQKDLWR